MKTLKYPLGNNRTGPQLADGQRSSKTHGNGGGTYKHAYIDRKTAHKGKK